MEVGVMAEKTEEKTGLEVAPGGEAVVDARASGANANDGVPFGKPIGELGADAGLEFDERGVLGARGVGEMDVSGTFARFGSEVVDGGDYALGVETPFDEEAVGGQATVERTIGHAVEIGNVAAADGSEPVDIEMSVFGFEGIEGPFDEANAATESVFALKEFETTANVAVAVRRQNARHVRVKIGRLTVEADVGLGETDHRSAIEGAENLTAGVVSDDVGSERFGVEVIVAPDFAGNLDAAVKFVEGVEGAD